MTRHKKTISCPAELDAELRQQSSRKASACVLAVGFNLHVDTS